MLLVDRSAAAAGASTAGRGTTSAGGVAAGSAVAPTITLATIAVIAPAGVLAVLVTLPLRVGVIRTRAAGVLMIAVVKEGKPTTPTAAAAAVFAGESRGGSSQGKTKCRCHQQTIQLHCFTSEDSR